MWYVHVCVCVLNSALIHAMVKKLIIRYKVYYECRMKRKNYLSRGNRARVKLDGLGTTCVMDVYAPRGRKIRGEWKIFDREGGPTESYAEWFHLYSWLTSRDAALSMVFRHFLIFHERFYGVPKFSAVAQRNAGRFC